MRLVVGCVLMGGLVAAGGAITAASGQKPGGAPESAGAVTPAATPASTAPATPAPATPATPAAEEAPIVTHHEVHSGNRTLRYTATVGRMPIKSEKGDLDASIFYVAYTLDGVTNPVEPLAGCGRGSSHGERPCQLPMT